MNKDERENYARIAQLGCIICQNPEVELHHIRDHTGMGLKSSLLLPFCHPHHRTGGYGIAFHAGRKAFEQNFGTQIELLEKVKALLV